VGTAIIDVRVNAALQAIRGHTVALAEEQAASAASAKALAASREDNVIVSAKLFVPGHALSHDDDVRAVAVEADLFGKTLDDAPPLRWLPKASSVSLQYTVAWPVDAAKHAENRRRLEQVLGGGALQRTRTDMGEHAAMRLLAKRMVGGKEVVETLGTARVDLKDLIDDTKDKVDWRLMVEDSHRESVGELFVDVSAMQAIRSLRFRSVRGGRSGRSPSSGLMVSTREGVSRARDASEPDENIVVTVREVSLEPRTLARLDLTKLFVSASFFDQSEGEMLQQGSDARVKGPTMEFQYQALLPLGPSQERNRTAVKEAMDGGKAEVKISLGSDPAEDELGFGSIALAPIVSTGDNVADQRVNLMNNRSDSVGWARVDVVAAAALRSVLPPPAMHSVPVAPPSRRTYDGDEDPGYSERRGGRMQRPSSGRPR